MQRVFHCTSRIIEAQFVGVQALAVAFTAPSVEAGAPPLPPKTKL